VRYHELSYLNISLTLTWIAQRVGLYFTSTYAQGNVAVGRSGMSYSVIYLMCYTCICGLWWSFASSGMQRDRQDQKDLTEVIGATT
jgi:hypothetical protein